MKVKAIAMDATAVKSEFGTLASKAAAADIGMQKRGRVQAYIISPERYEYFKRLEIAKPSELERLDAQYAGLMARMQKASHRHAVDQLMTMSEDEVNGVVQRAPRQVKAVLAKAAARKPVAKSVARR